MELCHVCGGWHRATPKTFDFPDIEDIHPAYNAAGFIISNEQPEIFAEFLGDMTFDKIVSICSGGEIPLFVLLPRVTGELIAVDHSYKALAVTIVKAQMLLSLGAKTFQEMTLRVDGNSWGTYDGRHLKEASVPFVKALPSSLQKALQDGDSWGHKLFCSMNCRVLKSHWEKANLEDIEKSLWNIRKGKLKLVHGDLTDVIPRGPFDLFYFSNAHEHISRHKAKPNFDNISQLIKSKGYILASQIFYNGAPKGWTELKSQSATRSDVSISKHMLFQKA